MTKMRTQAALLQSVKKPAFAEVLAPLNAEAFAAWTIAEFSQERLYPIDIDQPSTLAEATQRAAVQCDHKDHFVVCQWDPIKNIGTLHFHAIKREAKRQYRRDPITGEAGWSQRLYPVLLFTVPVHAFDPVEPWRWEPGADVVGVDRTLIEGRAK